MGLPVKEFVTEVEIEAPTEVAWRVLEDLPDYESWNPMLRRVQGRLEEGRRLRVLFQPTGWRAHRFYPKLLSVVPGREIRWTMPFKVPGLYDFEHYWVLQPLEGGKTILKQGVRLSGLLAPLIWWWLRRAEGPFREMNEAHKKRAEALKEVSGDLD
jgi:hypothetical protein